MKQSYRLYYCADLFHWWLLLFHVTMRLSMQFRWLFQWSHSGLSFKFLLHKHTMQTRSADLLHQPLQQIVWLHKWKQTFPLSGHWQPGSELLHLEEVLLLDSQFVWNSELDQRKLTSHQHLARDLWIMCVCPMVLQSFNSQSIVFLWLDSKFAWWLDLPSSLCQLLGSPSI